MRFAIEKEIFLKGLARIQGIVEKKNTIPILANVLIEATEGEIKLTATDLEVGMKASYPATVHSPGKISVSAKKLYEIIKELPEKEVEFNAKDNCWIEIHCEKAYFNIVGLSAEEFPFFPHFHKENFISIKSSLIKEMIDKTFFSISSDENKYNLSGIYFVSIEKNEKNYLRLVATDGHRLSLIEKPINVSDIEQLNKGVIFPKKGIFELKKMAEENDGEILIGFFDNNAVIQKNQIVVVMRLVDGEFPDYNRVIPKSNDLNIILNRDLFLHALRRMSIFSSEKSKGIKIDIKKDTLEMSSSNPEFGDAKEDIVVDYKGEDISVGFNARYLIDILNSLNTEKICLSLRDKLSPGLINSYDSNEYLAVIMPMKL